MSKKPIHHRIHETISDHAEAFFGFLLLFCLPASCIFTGVYQGYENEGALAIVQSVAWFLVFWAGSWLLFPDPDEVWSAAVFAFIPFSWFIICWFA